MTIRFLILLTFIFSFAFVDAKTCNKCERIRDENFKKAREQNWEFYEDWLEKDKANSEDEDDDDEDDDDEKDSADAIPK